MTDKWNKLRIKAGGVEQSSKSLQQIIAENDLELEELLNLNDEDCHKEIVNL
ncbi:hypothetical protein Psfp_04062 [Pelotomaculum sp. FP]|uniref:hypothetical protein n=1 Tax=Pelotomaculum sp. FP TaxID=261474 RepID=UPI00110306A9|nr:hypothetical protein [Pelotomaculum sp. FP]TEB11009.1 hypothetical protein Psfp_04062 [Pelotomaculum sp. FP]